MKICITSEGNTPESTMDSRFGRCPYFILADTDTMEMEAVRNDNAELRGGAGIQSGQKMSELGVSTVITGKVGPNASRTLEAAGIEVITGVDGTVQDALEKFKNGTLKAEFSAS